MVHLFGLKLVFLAGLTTKLLRMVDGAIRTRLAVGLDKQLDAFADRYEPVPEFTPDESRESRSRNFRNWGR